jgi:hypothetical protein
MKKPLNLQEVFKKTRASVYDASKGTQFPAIYDQIVKGDFYFTLPNIKPTPPKPEPVITQIVKPQPVIVQPSPVITSSKWITPTKEEVSWEKAKELCRENGARLPTFEELKKVVTDCGGILNNEIFGADIAKNKKNNRYQKCYKQKGFNSSYYWSSTTSAFNNDYAGVVLFRNGLQNSYRKDTSNYVRCVRAGQ